MRLADGTKAYIRETRLSLSGDKEPERWCMLATQIRAIVIAPEAPGRQLEASLKATLPDPWLDFARRYRTGSEVEGTVMSVVSNGVHVEVIPGVSGFVPLDQIAPLGSSLRPANYSGQKIESRRTSRASTPRSTEMLLSIRQYISQRGASSTGAIRDAEATGARRRRDDTSRKSQDPQSSGPLAEASGSNQPGRAHPGGQKTGSICDSHL